MSYNREKAPAAGVWELKRPKSVKDQVIDTILEGITEGRLPVGAPLPSEAELCREMGISRVALREAIKQLEVLGFLKIRRGTGTIVTTPDFRCTEMIIDFLGSTSRISLRDLHELRSLIEIEAVRQAAARGDEKLVRRLEKILDEGVDDTGRKPDHAELDFRFRREILEASPNRLLSMLLTPFDTYLKKRRVSSSRKAKGTTETLHTHRKIIDAIRKRYPDGARRLMQDHAAKAAAAFNDQEKASQ